MQEILTPQNGSPQKHIQTAIDKSNELFDLLTKNPDVELLKKAREERNTAVEGLLTVLDQENKKILLDIISFLSLDGIQKKIDMLNPFRQTLVMLAGRVKSDDTGTVVSKSVSKHDSKHHTSSEKLEPDQAAFEKIQQEKLNKLKMEEEQKKDDNTNKRLRSFKNTLHIGGVTITKDNAKKVVESIDINTLSNKMSILAQFKTLEIDAKRNALYYAERYLARLGDVRKKISDQVYLDDAKIDEMNDAMHDFKVHLQITNVRLNEKNIERNLKMYRDYHIHDPVRDGKLMDIMDALFETEDFIKDAQHPYPPFQEKIIDALSEFRQSISDRVNKKQEEHNVIQQIIENTPQKKPDAIPSVILSDEINGRLDKIQGWVDKRLFSKYPAAQTILEDRMPSLNEEQNERSKKYLTEINKVLPILLKKEAKQQPIKEENTVKNIRDENVLRKINPKTGNFDL